MKSLLTFILMLCSLHCAAEIYKWTDENGKVHFGDANSKPLGKNVEKLSVEINTYTNVTYEVTRTKSDRVIMYSASWCGYCKKAREYFNRNNISFTEYDIDKDQRANRRHKNMGASGVPVILYKGKRMNGFSESGFKRMYQPDA